MNDGLTFSLTQFFKRFPDERAARIFIEQKRWGNSPVCPFCGQEHGQHSVVRYRKGKRIEGTYKCQGCKKVYTVRKGTIFEASHISLQAWLLAIYFVLTNRHGISSYQISKHLGVTQKSTWFMPQRIREACKVKADNALLEGIVEIDEVYIGGKEMNKHESKKQKKGRGTIGKAPVVGMKARGGKVHAFVVPATDRATVHALINRNVAKGSTLYTDEAVIYNGLDAYTREFVSHSNKEFSRDGISTNGIESVWACVRRAIIGTWHGVRVQHLQRYIDEVCFRLNDGSVENGLMGRMESLLEEMFATPHMDYETLTAA